MTLCGICGAPWRTFEIVLTILGTVAKSDGSAVTSTKLPDGKFKAQGGCRDQEAHFGADQVLEVRFRGWAASLPPAPEGSGPREHAAQREGSASNYSHLSVER